MAIIYSDFYYEMFKIKVEMEKNLDLLQDKEDYTMYKSITVLLRRALMHYDVNKWESTDHLKPLKEYYLEFKVLCYTRFEEVAFFLLFDTYGKQIRSQNMFALYALVQAVTIAKINPHNYKTYWKMFLSPGISSLLSCLELEECTTIMVLIIKRCDFDKIQRGNYNEVERILADLTNTNYSPVFSNDFSPLNVYLMISNIIRLYPSEFKSDDLKILKYILSFPSISSSKDYEAFKNELSSIEKGSSTNQVQIVKKTIKLIRKYWTTIKGIKMIITPLPKEN